MNLDRVRNSIREKMHTKLHFVYHSPRNQTEKFTGKIIQCFPSIFVVLTTENITKSFSYNDFIVGNLKICSCETK
ncbi:MAG: hypothetical protein IJI60_00420 [Bacilli bacterium]|nr:hypothetical protein [Bacilli bacterium]